MTTMVLAALFLLLPMVASAQNNPPVADAGEGQTVFLGQSVFLDGSATDADGDEIEGWHWVVESSPPGSTPILSAEFSAAAGFDADIAGDYSLSLIAYDGTDWSAPDLVVITYVLNEPPTAVGTASPTTGPAPLTVQFDGTGSFDPEGQPLVYLWEFGDGTPPALAPTPIHTFQDPGTYHAELAVQDDAGQIDYDTVIITVTAPAVPSMHPIALYVVLPSLLVGVGSVAMRRRGGDS